LPNKDVVQKNDEIQFLYSADGTLLQRKYIKDGVQVSKRDYVGYVEYYNNIIDAIYNTNGRAVFETSGLKFEYFINDNLGNIRAIFCDDDNNGIITGLEKRTINDFYPFGLAWDNRWKLNDTILKYNNFLYNSKEMVSEMSLNHLIYGFRNYDSTIGRWWNVDPVSELALEWSPYRFCFNNPILYVDLDGLFETKAAAKKYAKEKDIYTGLFSSNKIIQQKDGTFAIENKSKHSSISDLGGDLGVVEGAMVAANDVMESKIASTGNLISVQLNVEQILRDGSSRNGELFNTLSLGSIGPSSKAIVIGEGMEAVKSAAKSLQLQGINAKWYQAWSKFFPSNRLMTPKEFQQALARNANWIKTKIKQGYKIYDIGIDASRVSRSPFYELEKNIINKASYQTHKLPK